jgi:hypothetical protein
MVDVMMMMVVVMVVQGVAVGRRGRAGMVRVRRATRSAGHTT